MDFVVLRDGKLEELIEAKWSDTDISPSLSYYAQKLRPERATQIVAHAKKSFERGQLSVLPAIAALGGPLGL